MQEQRATYINIVCVYAKKQVHKHVLIGILTRMMMQNLFEFGLHISFGIVQIKIAI